MSLVTQISDLATRIGTEFKAVYTKIGNLTSLTTTEKASVVGAINEIKAATSSAAGINDTTTSTSSTWSSSKTSTELATKAPLASPAFTGTPTGITKTHVGLANVDNTSDANKPVSTAQATAIALKANLASPTFTGTVGGITKAMVGLANVDNTADTAKPVSTAQAAAIAALINDASATNATATTYSANKINTAISTAVAATVNSAPGTLDTLDELAAALGDDPNFATTVTTSIGNRVRYDAAQALTAPQQVQARTNIAAVGTADVGDTTRNFVTDFEAALV